jgi:hypothetical protein
MTWSALFLSLGWNFWEYGLADGPVWGWIICGVVFVLMGGLPLMGLLDRDYFQMTFWSDASPQRPQVLPKPLAPAVSTRQPSVPASDSLTDALAQLALLHRQGSLTDEEFAQAKRRILEDS